GRPARGRAGPAGELPLLLRRDEVGSAFLAAEPAAELPRVLHRDLDDRLPLGRRHVGVSPGPLGPLLDRAAIARLPPARAGRLDLGLVARLGDELPELAHRHLAGVKVERAVELDPPRRRLPAEEVFLPPLIEPGRDALDLRR